MNHPKSVANRPGRSPQCTGTPPHWTAAAKTRTAAIRATHNHRRWSPPSHCTLCRLRPAHLQNAHATLTLGCRCHPCETQALGCCWRLCETLTLGGYCRLCETLALGRYCSRYFQVSLINFCRSDLWCVNESRLLIPLDRKNACGSNTHNRESTAEKLTTHDWTWFGRQLQPTSTRETIRFSLYPVAHQLQVQWSL